MPSNLTVDRRLVLSSDAAEAGTTACSFLLYKASSMTERMPQLSSTTYSNDVDEYAIHICVFVHLFLEYVGLCNWTICFALACVDTYIYIYLHYIL